MHILSRKAKEGQPGRETPREGHHGIEASYEGFIKRGGCSITLHYHDCSASHGTPRGMLASHWPAAGLASLDLTRRRSTEVVAQQFLRLCRTGTEEN